MLRQRVALALATILCISLGIFAPADGATPGIPAYSSIDDPAAVQQLASDFDLSIGEAQRRITLQPALSALSVEAADLLPDYAGAYIDQADSGQLIIRTTGQTSAAQALIDSASLATDVKIDPTATYTYDSLYRDTSDLTSRFNSLPEHIIEEIIIDVQDNVVDVYGPPASELPSDILSIVNGIPDLYAGAVQYLSNPVGDSITSDGLCYQENPYEAIACDPPLRGGVWITQGTLTDDTYCTGGFIGASTTNGAVLLITAGHCVQEYSGDWGEKEPAAGGYDGNIHVLGSRWAYSIYNGNGDIGAIVLNNVNGWQPQPYVFVGQSSGGHPTVQTQEYTITAVDSGAAGDVPISGAPPGAYLCHTGATSGTNCGVVTSSGDSIDDGPDGGLVGNLGHVDAIGCTGDSGGPFYVAHTAYGVDQGLNLSDTTMMEGINQALQTCSDSIYYSELSELSDIYATIETS